MDGQAEVCHAVAVSVPEADWVVLAHIVRPQGRKGEVLCDLLTDFPEKFSERTELRIQCVDGQVQQHQLESFWLPTGNSAGRVVLKFAGVDSISAAEGLAACDVIIPESERVPLEADSFYVSDLQGCVLVNVAGDDGPEELGTVTDVHFPADISGRKLENAAPLLIVTRSNGDEVMVPLAKEFMRSPDLKNRRIEMHLPHGLVEANG